MSKAQWIKENLKPGEHYAGLILGKDGAPDHHLVLLPDAAEKLTWTQAKAWAKKAGGELPNRREQSLLFANLKEQFEGAWYWSSEAPASDESGAWSQHFHYGDQSWYVKGSKLRARAVRRISIE